MRSRSPRSRPGCGSRSSTSAISSPGATTPTCGTSSDGHWTLLERGEPGEVYNLCSGRSWLIQEVLDFYLRESLVKDIAVKTDPARMRPSDVMILEGDPSKIAKLGWKVEIPFERTLADLLAYWRQRTLSARH